MIPSVFPESGGNLLSNYVTIMVIPQKSGRVIRFKLSSLLTKLVLLVFVGGIVISSLILVDYLSVKETEAQQREMMKSFNLQKFQIKEAINQLVNDREELEKLKVFERKLRIISGLSGQRASIHYVGDNSALPNSLAEFESEAVPIHDKLKRMDHDLNLRKISFFELGAKLQEHKDRLDRTPSIAPLAGSYSSSFGVRTDPFTGKKRMHRGLDIINHMYTPIYAPADGIVVAVTPDKDFGMFLVIDHGYDVVTRYGHMASFNVKVGQYVRRGDLIARMGNTGRSSGPHLHYEILVKDRYVDPEKYILD